MTWWVYKCNSQRHSHQKSWGDWDDFFNNPSGHWGNIHWTPDLRQLRKGHRIIAYQTNRNELVGIAKVHKARDAEGFVYLSSVERIGAKVRPLKKNDPKIAAIPSLQPGRIATLYSITPQDAARLLKAARLSQRRRSA